MFSNLLFVALGTLLMGSSLFADDHAPPHKGLDVGRTMRITYSSPVWNHDSTKIDTAYIILRDRNSGKVVQIQLEETEPDSGQFTGQFHVGIGDQEKISPEIYIPPHGERTREIELKKAFEMIQKGGLPRKPLIWKRNERGQAVMDVYDTREQAEAGMKAYEAEQKLAQEIRRTKTAKPMNSQEAMVAAASAERKTQMEKLAQQAVQRENERVRLAQIEKQKAADRAEEMRRMSESEKAARRAKAVTMNSQAVALYDKGDYAKAEEKFKQAVELNPESKEYYYKYGVTLYRNKKYNDALVILKAAKVDPAQDNERKYYMGLVHYRLAELDNALHQFNEVAKSQDATLGPSATFYAGVILYAQEKYEAAKKAFEGVIDTSKDPSMDDQAEEYLDKIAGAMVYQKLRENKFTLMAVVGAMYDSNVLLSPDNVPGTGKPTNTGDFRLLTVMDLQYRPIFSEHQEWAPHATVNLTNSAKNTSAPADPFIYTLAAPYSYKATFDKKANKFTMTPGYELLFMDPQSTGTKTEQMGSYYLTFDDALVVNKDWVTMNTLEYRRDNSFDPTNVGPNSFTANKYTVRSIQTLFMDKARKSALMPAVDYISDQAQGSNRTYSRYDLGLTYVRPIPWKCAWNVGLTYYKQTFPNTSAPLRRDNDYSFATGVSKPIRDWITWGVSGNYSKNDSTDPNYTYTKYTILTTATIVTNF